jgi:transposase
MGYPLKFREHVMKTKKEEGLSYVQVAKQFRIGLTTVMRWTKRITPKSKRNKPALKIPLEALREDVERHADAYQWERAARFGVSIMAICYALRKLGVTYKKNASSIRRLTLLPEKISKQR